LSRARPYNRPQYLRVKAIALREHGGKDHRRAAGELFERVIRDYPDSYFDLVVAHEQLALLAEEDDLPEQAIRHYRNALNVSEEGAPHGDAILRLPELLIGKHSDPERLREAAIIVGRIDPDRDLAFSSQRFRYNALRAVLAEQDGDSRSAVAFANAALAEWHRSTPDFTRHPTLGWVQSTPETLAQLARLAAND
jgi:tetratricopeptide (TPR) repeat protein